MDGHEPQRWHAGRSDRADHLQCHLFGCEQKVFFHEPAQGLIQSPENFVAGFGKGVAGLVKNIVGGTFSAVQSATGVVSRGLQTLHFEDDEATRREPDGLLQGIGCADSKRWHAGWSRQGRSSSL